MDTLQNRDITQIIIRLKQSIPDMLNIILDKKNYRLKLIHQENNHSIYYTVMLKIHQMLVLY